MRLPENVHTRDHFSTSGKRSAIRKIAERARGLATTSASEGLIRFKQTHLRAAANRRDG
jgi:hypothetical protein